MYSSPLQNTVNTYQRKSGEENCSDGRLWQLWLLMSCCIIVCPVIAVRNAIFVQCLELLAMYVHVHISIVSEGEMKKNCINVV